MKLFIVYDNTSGAILRKGSCADDEVSIQATELNELVIEGDANLASDYVLGGVITARPANPATINKTTFAADGIDTCVISNMLNPSTVSFVVPSNTDPIDTYTDTDGTLTFSALEAGEYSITLSSFPYLDKVFNLTAV